MQALELSLTLKTEAHFFTTLYIKDIFDELGYGDIENYYVSLNIIMHFTGYKLLDEGSGEEKGTGGTPEAHYQNHLYACWINVPLSESYSTGIGALEHLIRVGTMFVVPADRFNTSSYSRNSDELTAFCYETMLAESVLLRNYSRCGKPAWREEMKLLVIAITDLVAKTALNLQNHMASVIRRLITVRVLHIAETRLDTVIKGPDRRCRNGRLVHV